MQAHATAERLALAEQLPTLGRTAPTSLGRIRATAVSDGAMLDHLLSRLADLVVDGLLERGGASTNQQPDDWMDARQAAAYLGVHRDTRRKLAAERTVPVHRDGPGCKLYFRRDELDDWRRSSRAPRSNLRAVS